MAVVVQLSVGHLKEHCRELLTKCRQGRRGPDTRWPVVPGMSSSHWKCPVANCGPAS